MWIYPSSHDWNNLSSCFKVVLLSDFQFGSKPKAKHMKIEHIGLKPDHGWSLRWDGVVMGRPAHVGGRAAHSWARSGPTLASVVLSLLLPEFCDFHDRILSWCWGVSPPHLWQNHPIYESTSTMATTKAIALSYLSPYKPGRPLSIMKDLE